MRRLTAEHHVKERQLDKKTAIRTLAQLIVYGLNGDTARVIKNVGEVI
jgi:hypothetical protein